MLRNSEWEQHWVLENAQPHHNHLLILFRQFVPEPENEISVKYSIQLITGIRMNRIQANVGVSVEVAKNQHEETSHSASKTLKQRRTQGS